MEKQLKNSKYNIHMTEFIYECENFLPSKICEDLIQYFEENPDQHTPGRTASGVDTKYKISTDMILSDSSEYSQNVRNILMAFQVKAFNDYKEYCKIHAAHGKNILNEVLMEGFTAIPQIQKTTPGGFYRWHCDSIIYRCSRLLSCIIYLNDVEEGCGGTTDFICGKSIQPKRGKILIFPSTWTYFHRGKQLTKGVKYLLSFFIWSESPDQESLS
jgi:hypothetical protein